MGSIAGMNCRAHLFTHESGSYAVVRYKVLRITKFICIAMGSLTLKKFSNSCVPIEEKHQTIPKKLALSMYTSIHITITRETS